MNLSAPQRFLPIPVAPLCKVASLVAMSLCASLLSAAADGGKGQPVAFTHGRPHTLRIAGKEVIDNTHSSEEGSGFFILLFNGSELLELPLKDTSWEHGLLTVRGERDFPRFTFEARQHHDRLELELIKMEGLPIGRDATLRLRLPTQRPLQSSLLPGGHPAAPHAPRASPSSLMNGKPRPGVEIENAPASLTIYWTYLGDRDAGAPLGGVALK